MTKTKQTTGWMSGKTKNIFAPRQNKLAKSKKLFYWIFTLCAVIGFSLGAGFVALFATTTFASNIEPSQVIAAQDEETSEIIEATPIIDPEPEPQEHIYYEPYIEEIKEVEETNYISVQYDEYEYIKLDYIEYDEYKYDEPEIPEPVIFVPVLQNPIPQARCYFKSWMDWRAITYRNSRQWRMQQIAYTCDDGFRRVDGLYMIALGTYFLYSGVGDVFDITLSSGVTFRAVVGDIKSDRHTDPTNRFHITDGSVIEFLVDRQVMCSQVLSRGNVSYAGFQGSIESIVHVPELFIAV